MNLSLPIVFAALFVAIMPQCGFAQDIPQQQLPPQLVSSQIAKIHQEEEAVTNCIHLLNAPKYTSFACLANHEKTLKDAYAILYPNMVGIQDEIIQASESLSNLWVDRSFLNSRSSDAKMQKEIFLKTNLPEQINLETRIDELFHKKQALLKKLPTEFQAQSDIQVNHWDAFLFSEESIMTRFNKD